MSRADGLSSDTLYGIVPDARGRLWLSGNAGLMRLDPESGAIKTYHREHGLQGEEFSFGAYFRLRDGRVAFGGPGGFNIFDPAALSENDEPPRVALTNVDVLGVRATGTTPFWLRDRIALDYRGTIVSLDFGVLDFTSPEHNRLAYRMAGLTDDWIDVGAQRRITLTNLDPGEHVLEVRAASADSVWSPRRSSSRSSAIRRRGPPPRRTRCTRWCCSASSGSASDAIGRRFARWSRRANASRPRCSCARASSRRATVSSPKRRAQRATSSTA